MPSLYKVQNHWGGSAEPWHEGGYFLIGNRNGQLPVVLHLTSRDKGETLTGTMTYHGEGPIGFRGVKTATNAYTVSNQWGGDAAPWHDGGRFVLGNREGQNVVALDIVSADGGKTFKGTMTYAGEGPIGFKGVYEGQGDILSLGH